MGNVIDDSDLVDVNKTFWDLPTDLAWKMERRDLFTSLSILVHLVSFKNVSKIVIMHNTNINLYFFFFDFFVSY